MDIAEKIIEYIQINKVSTTEVADCLGKIGRASCRERVCLYV